MILLFSHFSPTNNFGASISLNYHLLWLKQFSKKICLIFPINFIFSGNPYKQYKCFFLPMAYNFNVDHFSNTKKRLIPFQKVKEILFKIFFKIIFATKEIKVVHLNSTVLIPIASFVKKYDKNIKVICHVREIIKPNLSYNELNYFKFVDIFICIDYSTYKSISRYKSKLFLKNNNSIQIVENPFSIKKHKKQLKRKKTFIFAGILSKFKGADFLYNIWKKNPKLPTLKFIGRMIEKKFLSLPHLKIYDEQNNLHQNKVFYNSFGLIRADPSFRIGRTCYEAICSGLYLILPKCNSNKMFSQFFHNNKEKILFYKPRSEKSLKAVIKKSLKLKYLKTSNFSNKGSYLSQVKQLYFE